MAVIFPTDTDSLAPHVRLRLGLSLLGGLCTAGVFVQPGLWNTATFDVDMQSMIMAYMDNELAIDIHVVSTPML